MSVPENESIVRHLIARFNEQDATVINELCADDFVNHDPMPGLPPTRQGWFDAASGLFVSIPDFHLRINDLISDEDKVVVPFRCTGTNEGQLFGPDAAGKNIDIEGIAIFRIRDGKIVERWDQFDSLKMMQQLGVVAPPIAA